MMKIFHLKRLIEQVEWVDPPAGTLIALFPTEGRKFKMGAQLTVKEMQAVVFMSEGKTADMFHPGRYYLNPDNLRELGHIRSWTAGHSEPFSADLFFVSSGVMAAQRWSTNNPVTFHSADLGDVTVWSEGVFSFRIVDPGKLLTHIFKSNQIYDTDYLKGHFKSLVQLGFANFLKSAAPSLAAWMMQIEDLSEQAAETIEKLFLPLGVELSAFTLEGIEFPEEIEEKLERYMIYGTKGSEAAPAAEAAPLIERDEQQSAVLSAEQAVDEEEQLANCLQCGGRLKADYKFCPDCGTERTNEKKRPECAECGYTLDDGMNFCPQCGGQMMQQADPQS